MGEPAHDLSLGVCKIEPRKCGIRGAGLHRVAVVQEGSCVEVSKRKGRARGDDVGIASSKRQQSAAAAARRKDVSL